MGTKRVKFFSSTLLVPITKWRIAESPPTFRYCCILHYLTSFLFFKPAAPSVFRGAMMPSVYVRKLLVLPQFPRVMYGDFSCYHSLYGFAVRTQIVLHALWESPIPGTENILSMSVHDETIL